MTIYQTLGLLIVIILIVWWALRRSAAEGEKEPPVGGDHGERSETGHAKEAEVDHEMTIPQRAESVKIPPIPEAIAAVPAAMPELELETGTVTAPEPAPELAPIRTTEINPDDLVIIEGIGPRISGILKTAGITKFAQLAEMKPELIKEILTGVDERLGRIADPTTWPQQAGLAARGEMEALQILQDSLKAGRKD
jgi:predicted flap endonuclease-1-like 5' DNA nuclease